MKIKKLFSTPKKASLTMIGLLAIIATLGTGTVYATSAIAQNSSIGAENAKKFSFADAGIDPATAKEVQTEFGYEQGQFVYEIEFIADGKEYEYLINASNGTVVEKDIELVTLDGKNEVTSAQISLEKAKEIALNDAKLTENTVTFTTAKLDMEDDISVYEIEFYSDNVEYEYEINANNGAVHDKSVESLSKNTGNKHDGADNVDNVDNKENSGTYIGIDKAKNIAANHAGLSISELTFSKAKLDTDDGNTVYDIEFYKDGIEYEYEIDASSGKILEYDAEQDD